MSEVRPTQPYIVINLLPVSENPYELTPEQLVNAEISPALFRGEDGKSPYVDEQGYWWEYNDESGEWENTGILSDRDAAEKAQAAAAAANEAKGNADAATQAAQQATEQATTAASDAQAAASNAISAAEAANAATEQANEATEGATAGAQAANAAAQKIEGMTVSAHAADGEPTAGITNNDPINIDFGLVPGPVYVPSVSEAGDLSWSVKPAPEDPMEPVNIKGPRGPVGPAGPGTGDMLASIYDPQERSTDIFDYVDKAVENVTVELPDHLIIGEEGELPPVELGLDADTLQGHSAAYFATAEQLESKADKAALDEKANKSELAIQSNPNLLNNWYFVGGGSQQGAGKFPINQRGNTDYSEMGYTIDRWFMNSSGLHTIKVGGDGLHIYGGAGDDPAGYSMSINQYIEGILPNGKYTFSALKSDGALLTYTFDFIGDLIGWIPLGDINMMFGIELDKWCTNLVINAINDETILAAVKLELSDHQTLAHKEGNKWVLNDIPDYATELLKCQRYQYVVGGATWYGFGYIEPESTRANINIVTPVVMRANPTITIPYLYVVSAGTDVEIENVSVIGWRTGNIVIAGVAFEKVMASRNAFGTYMPSGFVIDANL